MSTAVSEVDQNLFNTNEWVTFINTNLDIYQRIKEYFVSKKNPYDCDIYLDTDSIIEYLQLEPVYVNQILSIWHTNQCTFYAKYGRLYYDNNKNLWRYTIKNTFD